MIFKMSVRIYQDENKVFGPGIAQLLHRVRELRSLRAAASSMNMAYSKAWTVLRTAENALGYKLLYSSAGAKTAAGPYSPPREKSFWSSTTNSAAGCRHTARLSLPSFSALTS